MNWVVFTYSLPSSGSSSPRVTLWRRLRRLGAVSPTGSVHILPARDECVEAFQWLAQELKRSHGESLVMHVAQFEGITDNQLIGLFQEARAHEYAELEVQVLELEQIIATTLLEERQIHHESLARLRRRAGDIRRIDYFDTPAGPRLEARLTALQQALSPTDAPPSAPASALVADYQRAQWVTRPRPHVDRLACIWLIRRFINPEARIRYSLTPSSAEVAFDMKEASTFGHLGNLCTFETMCAAFGFNETALQVIAEIVHEIDLRDGIYTRPETAGVDALLSGWLHENVSDAELEARGVALFSGLYAAFSQQSTR